MSFQETLLIPFICAALNHLGLIAAAEGVIRHSIPVLNCPKCSSFWLTLAVLMLAGFPNGILIALATSLLMAWLARWVELLMGGIDVLYSKVYDTFYPTAAVLPADAPAAEREADTHTDAPQHPLDAVPDVW